MSALNSDGVYEVDEAVANKLSNEFYGGCCDDEMTAATIRKMMDKYGYLCDTHTAVAIKVYDDYVEATGDKTPTVIASTASAYKFSASVLKAVCDSDIPQDEFETVDKLSSVTSTPIPAPLAGLKEKKVLHTGCVDKEQMADFIKNFLK